MFVKNKDEEKWNSISHSMAIGYSAFAFFYFNGLPIKILSLFLTIVFILSVLYHSEDNLEKKAFFRMLDMSSVHLLIPATAAAYSSLGVSFSPELFVIIGIIFSLYVLIFYRTRLLSETMVKSCILSGSISTTIFLLNSPSLKIVLIFMLGVLAYLCGIYFYINDNKNKWFHTIWHIFVIIGSLIHIKGLI
jgi:hemolysin III